MKSDGCLTRRCLPVAFAWLSLCCIALAEDAPKAKKVLLIGIDGCRFDAVRVADAPNLVALAQQGLLDDRCRILGDRYRGSDTISGPGWSSILTGVWADKHGVDDNEFKQPNYERYPHFFRHVKDQRPDARTVSIADWKPIQEIITSAADVSLAPGDGKDYVDGDARSAEAAVRVLAETDPAAMFVYFGQVDETGHQHGFHPSVPQYIAAIERVDRLVGDVLRAVRARPGYESEDWMVLVTSDHGGKGTGHGGGHDEPEILNSFLIVSGTHIEQSEIQGTTYLVDAVPTALAHLGVEVDAAWGLDGRAVPVQRPPQ